MYVCICNAVTDKEIEIATNTGACTMKDLRNSLSVATSCGKCSGHAKGLLTEYLSVASQPEIQTS